MQNKESIDILNTQICIRDKMISDKNIRNRLMAWYSCYSRNNCIEEFRLIELLVFLYHHVDLDCYELSHYLRISDFLCSEYGVEKDTIPEMISVYRSFLQ